MIRVKANSPPCPQLTYAYHRPRHQVLAMLLALSFLQGLHASLNSSSSGPISSFNVTTISAMQGQSVLQCWQITEPLAISTQTGIAGAVSQSLGDAANLTWSSLPARFPGTAHPAPQVQ